MTGPALVIGLPLYGRGEHLQEALESLLGQTRRDIAIVATDDASEPDAKSVLDGLADPRLSYHRNERRLGLVGNWRRSFEAARRAHPEARFFAWASDHDAWHPLWAERLLALLEAEDDAVVAYPLTYRTDRDGWTLTTKRWSFDTAGLDARSRRLRAAIRGMSAGNMVYGVYRIDALERVDEFPYSLLPDRLLLTELSVLGHLRQVPEWLFYRRVTETPSIERQRAAFWPDGHPRRATLPWSWQHVALFNALLRRVGLARRERLRLAAIHAVYAGWTNLISGWGRIYYEKIMRRRSLKKMGVHAVGHIVVWLQRRAWGEAVLGAGRRVLAATTRR